MPKQIDLIISPETFANEDEIKSIAAKKLQCNKSEINHIQYLRKSLDARSRNIKVLLKIAVYLNDEVYEKKLKTFDYKPLKSGKTCHIIGFGPAGIYAALQCLENGIKPIIIERGKEVNQRISDIGNIHRKLSINPDSNYCFGEGGAGTYSDGKLYTRSSKRGDIKKVLDVFIEHGAEEKIAFEAHPHIGTNRLPKIIERMRNEIINKGGEVHFNKKLSDLEIEKNKIAKIICADGDEMPVQQLILATGHSARDIYELLHRKSIAIEAKPFALGVRIEHSQELIDSIQYKRESRGAFLPPASYNLVTQACGRGVFSFCMCPGGVIAPAATNDGEIVVNGWSGSMRNGKFANSGMVVSVEAYNWQEFEKHGALAALEFQKTIEQKAFQITRSLKAPAQRVDDFIRNKTSLDLPRTSYQPGITPAPLEDFLPKFISKSLREGLSFFGKKLPGFRNNDAILVGVESRTSSPVRIPRDKESFRHPEIVNLYPCGEGAGYAGGIVSAAMDGMACANALVN